MYWPFFKILLWNFYVPIWKCVVNFFRRQLQGEMSLLYSDKYGIRGDIQEARAQNCSF